MREILFRGKRIDNGEWVIAKTLVQLSGGDKYMPLCGDKLCVSGDKTGNICRIDVCTLYKVDPATVGQYTGLTDKNGAKIFEGDTLQYFDDEIQVVEWSDPAAGIFEGQMQEAA